MDNRQHRLYDVRDTAELFLYHIRVFLSEGESRAVGNANNRNGNGYFLSFNGDSRCYQSFRGICRPLRLNSEYLHLYRGLYDNNNRASDYRGSEQQAGCIHSRLMDAAYAVDYSRRA